MEKEEKIRVVVRARPYLGSAGSNNTATSTSKRHGVQDVGERECVAASPDRPDELLVYQDATHSRAASFRCDTFLSSTASQEDVFDEIGAKDLVASALQGFPVTIFAYGQTGAGKSYTIFGQEDGATEHKLAVQPEDGLLPRAAEELMRAITARKGEVDYTLRVTCVEIYNEQVRDVFDPRKEALAVRSSKKHGFFLENATVVECVTAREIVRVVKAAATHRAKSSHLLNERSNRSHCLVTIYIDAAPCTPIEPGDGGGKRYGKLTIVDLAGSERATDSGAVGSQLRETCHINRSLHCLSQVIQALNAAKSCRSGKRKFVPFRDSKLTMLLLDSLGGNSKTLMLACVNSSPQFATESVRTLEFAMGVAKIKNRPTALLSPHEKLISDLKEQIRLLKLENMMLRARTPGYFLDHPGQQLEPPLTSRSDDRMEHDERFGLPTHAKPMRCSNQHPGSLSLLQRVDPASRQRTVQHGLQTLKCKTQLRGGTKSPKKKSLARKSTSFIDRHALPPVGQRAAPPRSLQYAVEPRHSLFQETSTPPARTDSPPPEYDDLFGIETVLVSRQQPTGSNLLASTVPSTESVRSQSTSSNKHAERPIAAARMSRATAITSPDAQLQQMLRQMLPQPTSTVPKNTVQRLIPPKVKSHIGNAAMLNTRFEDNNEIRRSSSHWDDQRAQQLFIQLCQL